MHQSSDDNSLLHTSDPSSLPFDDPAAFAMRDPN